MKNFLYLAMTLYALSGCAHEVELTYHCEPSGATLYQEGTGKLGECPVKLLYSSDDIQVKDGKIYTTPTKAVWVSGATAFMPATVVDISPDRKASLTLTRPQDAAGYEKDESYSAEFEATLPVPGEVYVISPHQDQDAFDGLNRWFTCGIDGITGAVYAQCP